MSLANDNAAFALPLLQRPCCSSHFCYTPVLAEAIAFALTAIIQAADSGIPQADLDIEQMKQGFLDFRRGGAAGKGPAESASLLLLPVPVSV